MGSEMCIRDRHLCDLVAAAATEAGRSIASPPLPRGAQRVLMHVDFDCFFASVALRTHPELRGRPVAVCHAAGQQSTAEIASCNYEARAFGVANGMSLGTARQRCPQLATVPYTFDAYMATSLQLYAILLDSCDALEVGSMDEALIDMSLVCACARALPPALRGVDVSSKHAVAAALQAHIIRETSCPVSIGAGANVLQARLATRRAKPGGVYVLDDVSAAAFVRTLRVDQLPGIGHAVRERLEEHLHSSNVGDILERVAPAALARILGPRRGRMLWDLSLIHI